MNTITTIRLIALGGLAALYVIGIGVAILLNRLMHLRVRRRAMTPALKHLMSAHPPDSQRGQVRQYHPPIGVFDGKGRGAGDVHSPSQGFYGTCSTSLPK
jgi:hypothetical protein